MHLVKLYFSSTFPIKSSYFFSLLTFLSFLFILFKSQPPALQKSWLTAACNHVDVDVGPDWPFRWCFCSLKCCLWLWLCGDVMTLKSLQLTPFCLDKSSVRTGIFECFNSISVRIWFEYCKICKNNNHRFVSLHLHLPGPSRDVWALGLSASSQTASSGPANDDAWKTCVIPILITQWLLTGTSMLIKWNTVS